MHSVVEQLELVLPARPESVAEARHAAVDLARDTGIDLADVEIAVSEAVGNAVIHAYPEGASRGRRTPANVRLIGTLYEGTLVFVVQDDGVGMRPHPEAPGLRLGLPLIGQVCDDVHIDTHDGGTRISMAFSLTNGGH